MSRDDVDIKIALKGAQRAAADARKVSGGLGGIGRSAQRADKQTRGLAGATGLLGRGLKGTAIGLGGAAAAATGLSVALGTRSVRAFQESRSIALDQAAALKTAGAQAGINQKQLNALATAQSRKTGIDDEAIAQSQTLLLTFSKIRNETGKGNDVYNRASQAVLDLSARFNKDLGSSATMVGKALQDPVKGVTALTRVGVGFSKQQIETIKSLEKSGDRLGAQRIILKELETQTKGSAAAQGTAMDKLAVATGNVEEAIGKGLSPVVDAAAMKLTNFAEGAEPLVSKASEAVAKVFARKDLTLGEKIPLAFSVAQADLKPLTDGVRREIGAMRLDDKLGKAIEQAAPALVDGVAAAAPHAAAAFARAFAEAGPGGQLLTVALLAAKLGAFRGAGAAAAGTFSGAFRKKAVGGLLGRQVAFGNGAADGRAYAAGFATTSGIGGGAVGKKGGAGGALRKGVGVAKKVPVAGAILTAELWALKQARDHPGHVDTQAPHGRGKNMGRTDPNPTGGSSEPKKARDPYFNPAPDPRLRNFPDGGIRRKIGLEAIVHSHVHLDGKQLSESNARVELRTRERQGG